MSKETINHMYTDNIADHDIEDARERYTIEEVDSPEVGKNGPLKWRLTHSWYFADYGTGHSVGGRRKMVSYFYTREQAESLIR